MTDEAGSDRLRRILVALFERYVDNPRLLPEETGERAVTDGPERTAADYIAGMTDRYANEEYLRLFDPTTRV